MNELNLHNLCYLGPLNHITLDHSHEGWHLARYEEYFAEHPEFKKWGKVIILTGNYALANQKTKNGYMFVPFNCWLHYIPRQMPHPPAIHDRTSVTKCFLSLVWTPRPDKVAIYARFLQDNIFQHFRLSMRSLSTVPFDYNMLDKASAQLQVSPKNITLLQQMLPLHIDKGEHINTGHIVHGTLDMPMEVHDTVHMSVVMETEFISNGINRVTEKTFKAIAYGHAFLVVGAPFCTRLLQELGFRTFHPFINESFDCVLEPDNRFNMIIVELQRLAAFNEHEWAEFHRQTRPIVEFNQARLYDKEFLQANINNTEGQVKSLY